MWEKLFWTIVSLAFFWAVLHSSMYSKPRFRQVEARLDQIEINLKIKEVKVAKRLEEELKYKLLTKSNKED